MREFLTVSFQVKFMRSYLSSEKDFVLEVSEESYG